ncbi:MAG: DAK2 domain-containing protein [Clostridia bacterium]|nr:DAK2 domain-containing protein [Clostridia bacterium]
MINGKIFREAMISASNNIANHKKEVDELNVFPVPDGDTGTNMSMTVTNAARRLAAFSDKSIGVVSAEVANALLRGARGNSGVITSLLFRGISKGLKGINEADGETFAKALKMGVDAAYKAVMKPTEGTILTVARMAAERALKVAETENDPVVVFREAYEEAELALERTPEMLPVLKTAGVVDSGGKGLIYIFEGMLTVFEGGEAIELKGKAPAEKTKKSAVSRVKEEIKFTYCTEFIVNKKNENVSVLKLRAYLESIGDSCVVVDDEQIIKVHVHTDHPGLAFEEGIKFGQLMNMKVENMRIQNEQYVENEDKRAVDASGKTVKSVAPEKDYGFVSVAAGRGLVELFKDLGADNVVSGGQTMNPSTDDILAAVEATPAKTVFVFPNNKNIIMAAEQAIPFATRKLVVIPTKSIPMGISAMLAFDEDSSVEDNVTEMRAAADNVGTGLITYAVRDSMFEGHTIKKGQLMAMANGKMDFVDDDLQHAVVRLTRHLTKKDSSMVTLIYGKDVKSADAEKAKAAVEAKISSDIEVALVNGGQPVYYYTISVE